MKLAKRHSDLPALLNERANGSLPPELAQALREEARKLETSDPAESFMLAGLASACDGELEKMNANFGQALALAPDDPAIIQNYAHCLARHGLFSQAISCLQELPELSPDACRTMGECCLALGLDGRARQYLEPERCGNTNPKDCPASSVAAEEAIKRVLASFEEDKPIWQSLSTR